MSQWILYIAVFLIELCVFARVRSCSIRQLALLAGSYVLYLSWGSWFAAVLLGSTAMNYLLGVWLRRRPVASTLWLAILLNVALLGAFKYLPEAAVQLPFSSLQRFAHLALPLGISFWTFQALSYLFDLYSGEELDPSFIEFALYMVFFPVTLSGPVCRLPEMLPQFRSNEPLPWNTMLAGLRRIATGFLMMQFARLLGHGVLGGDGISSGFDQAKHWSGPDAWCLAFGYGLQLFFDFAGYSHMAIGAAKALGFTPPENFQRPFASTTVSIFWTRWHMSLSFWIRDYVFLPLAMVGREIWWRNFVLVLSMVLFGLWHKATVLFLLWGAYHGVLLVLHRILQQLQRGRDWNPPQPLWSVLAWASTIAMVSLGWIFFRANTFSEAASLWSAVVAPASYSTHFLSKSLYVLVLIFAAGYGAVALAADILAHANENATHAGVATWLAANRWTWLPPLYAITLLLILIVNATQGASAAQFMYRSF